MKIIGAGWRMEYIEKEEDGKCIFCERVEGGKDEENLVVRRGITAFVLMKQSKPST